MQKNNFEIANNYLGWGDPSHGVWFMGIEEFKKWDNDLINKTKDKPYEACQPWKSEGKGRIPHITSEIVSKLSKKWSGKSWEEYRDKVLWTANSQVFQTNIFPLGKPNLKDWPQEYNALFGFGLDDRAEYVKQVKNHRFKKIKELWDESAPQATICFGKTYWHYSKEIFGLEKSTKKIINNASLDLEVYADNDKKIILTPFFGRGLMTDKNGRIKEVSKILASWGVEIS